MQISQDGINLIKGFEGCRYTAYQDSAGVWTIGYGHTAKVFEGMRITPDEAMQYLTEDLIEYENYVSHYVTVPLTQHQFDALVSFTYNLGPGTLARSDLLAVLNAGQYDNAADMFTEYDQAGGEEVPGLRRRRQAERDLFLTPDQTSGWKLKLRKWLIG